MQNQSRHLNIPIEIIRTLVAITDTGSFTKAGDILGLSQPAISSQVKRVQSMIGGDLFKKTAAGSVPTKLGSLILTHARKIIECNDQMLRLGGSVPGPQAVRLGISNLYVQEFLKHCDRDALARSIIHTDNSGEITKRLIDGYLDLACFFDSPEMTIDIRSLIIKEREEHFVWARSREFVLSPGAPIPILSWAGAVTDGIMIRALMRDNLQYRIAFNSTDYHAKLSAAECGVGLTIIPERMIPQSLIRADEYYLPKLTPIKSYLCARAGIDSELSTTLLGQLASLFFDKTPPKKAA